MKYWKTIANKIIRAGFRLGWASALDFEERTIWIADAYRDDGKRFIVGADEKLTAFLEPGSGPSSGTPRGDFCQPWRGQAAPRLNRRAATPSAIKVNVRVPACFTAHGAV